MKIIEVTFKRFTEDPFWFVISLCCTALFLSWTARKIYCGWVYCGPEKPAISVEVGNK